MVYLTKGLQRALLHVLVGICASFLMALFGFYLVGDTWMQYNFDAQTYFTLYQVRWYDNISDSPM
jgi:hypothetical protein